MLEKRECPLSAKRTVVLVCVLDKYKQAVSAAAPGTQSACQISLASAAMPLETAAGT